MLIFDSFPDRRRAESFASYITAEWDREAKVFDSQEESNKIDIFPYELRPPIVLVERDFDNFEPEKNIRETVKSFGGSFAGT